MESVENINNQKMWKQFFFFLRNNFKNIYFQKKSCGISGRERISNFLDNVDILKTTIVVLVKL